VIAIVDAEQMAVDLVAHATQVLFLVVTQVLSTLHVLMRGKVIQSVLSRNALFLFIPLSQNALAFGMALNGC